MAAPSTSSIQKGKKNTGRTASESEPKFSQEDAIQIINKAIQTAIEAKLPVLRTPLYEDGNILAGLIIRGAHWDGDILALNTGNAVSYTGNGKEDEK